MALKKIYVCSPLASYVGNPMEQNIEKAKGYCSIVMRNPLDFIPKEDTILPIAPHIYCTQFLDDNIPTERECGLYIGLELLKECAALIVFTDYVSSGMKGEIEYCKKNDIPVYKYENGSYTKAVFVG